MNENGDGGGRCPFCGSPVQENAAFCLHCMKELGEKKVIEKEKRREKLVPALICALVILILCLAAAIIIPAVQKRADAPVEKAESTASETTGKNQSGKSGRINGKNTEKTDKNETETQVKAETKAADNSSGSAESMGRNESEQTANTAKTAESEKAAGTVTPKPGNAETTAPAASKAPEVKKAPVQAAHTHSYTESTVKAASCALPGEKKYTCSCGDSYTKSIPATGAHSWTAVTKTVHHNEEGHYEEQQTGSKKVTKYKCFYCYSGTWYDSFDELKAHFASHSYDPNYDYLLNHLDAMCTKKDSWEPIYENVWVVDRAAYDETVTVGYKCSVCGTGK